MTSKSASELICVKSLDMAWLTSNPVKPAMPAMPAIYRNNNNLGTSRYTHNFIVSLFYFYSDSVGIMLAHMRFTLCVPPGRWQSLLTAAKSICRRAHQRQQLNLHGPTTPICPICPNAVASIRKHSFFTFHFVHLFCCSRILFHVIWFVLFVQVLRCVSPSVCVWRDTARACDRTESCHKIGKHKEKESGKSTGKFMAGSFDRIIEPVKMLDFMCVDMCSSVAGNECPCRYEYEFRMVSNKRRIPQTANVRCALLYASSTYFSPILSFFIFIFFVFLLFCDCRIGSAPCFRYQYKILHFIGE